MLKAIFFALAFSIAGCCYAAWPNIALPEKVNSFLAGEEIIANGVPMRVKGFVSPLKVEELQAWFRRSLGQPLVENTLGAKRILGRAQEGYYLTVQIEPAGKDLNAGSKGLVTVSDIKRAGENHSHYAESTQRWLQRWPSGSKIISHVVSDDDGKASSHVVLTNGYSEELNRDAIKNILRQDGFFLERESLPVPRLAQDLPAMVRNARTLFFKGDGREAIAVIQKNELGRTAIVLNTITQLERIK